MKAILSLDPSAAGNKILNKSHGKLILDYITFCPIIYFNEEVPLTRLDHP